MNRHTNGHDLLANPEGGRLDDLVDVQRLGLDGTPERWQNLGESMRGDLERHGLVTIPGFLRKEAVRAVADTLEQALPYVSVVTDRRTAYGRTPDPSVDGSASVTSDWIAGHVTRDMIPAQSPAHRLYVSPFFKRLIGAAMGVTRLFEYADPLAGLVATVLPSGGCYGWHYDTNEFVVTIAIQPAARGGVFEFYQNLRTPGDENLDGLASVVGGKREQDCRSVLAAPGDLQIFRGRYSLHRVTKNTGSVPRLTLVLSYADRPGVIGPVDRTRRVYGRVTEAHLVAGAGGVGSDGLIL
jgi:hypothetical protein